MDWKFVTSRRIVMFESMERERKNQQIKRKEINREKEGTRLKVVVLSRGKGEDWRL
jgi:hypothetical protein